ncbi:MAG TPA: AAA family ATPase [Ilumatobacter sp.]|nr:AAA family ATPase [Ilumatobacter sp.]
MARRPSRGEDDGADPTTAAEAASFAPAGIVGHVLGLADDLAGLVAARRAVAPAGTGPGHGAFVGELDVDAALAAIRARGGVDAGPVGGVDALGELFGLTAFEMFALVAAVAPQVEPHVATLYAYLNDDLQLRSATAGLIVELAGLPPWAVDARRQLSGAGRLAASGLLTTTDDGPFHRRPLVATDRVVRHLLGDDQVSDVLRRCAAPAIAVDHPSAEPIVRLLDAEQWFVYLRGRHDDGAAAVAAGALEREGFGVLHVDLSARHRGVTPDELLREAVRESALQFTALLIGPLDAIAVDDRAAVDLLHTAVVPVVVYGQVGWDPAWCRRMPAIVDLPPLAVADRRQVWERALDAAGISVDAAAVAATFHLSPAGIHQAVQTAIVHARALGRPVAIDDIARGARSRNGVSLERLARRVVPRAGFDELVLAETPLAHVHDLVLWARNRDRVIDELGVRGRGTKGRGVAGLFVGSSGTGKTLSAEVVAGALGLDLYVVDLSTVVSKYIGETEENLERIFREATGINGVLFFDEADALFGKRSSVSDSKDRYANMEVAYLLQRMEQFDGLSLLASNLRANLDEAFLRRLDFVITFPEPTPAERRRLWEVHLPPTLPRAVDVDVGALAERFTLSGGEIANAARAAGHLAVRDDGRVSMLHLVQAVAHEYDKAGRLLRADDFGPWIDQVVRR